MVPPTPPEDRRRAIIKIVLEVEAAKMINPPLTDQQRYVLMCLLSDTGLPISMIAELGRKVVGKKTYNTIAFEHWKSEIVPGEYRSNESEPDRACYECGTNHKWNEVCPKQV